VFILPPGHAQNVSARYRFSRREKWILGSVLATVAALAVVVIIAISTADPTSGNGCINVTVASSMGAQPLSGCGARARTMCRLAGTPGGYTGSLARALATECRKAGIQVG
jgi:hypothetical protein